MADFFKQLKKVRRCSKPQSPFAEFTTGNYFGFKRFAEADLLAYADFSSWPDQRLPLQRRIRRNLPGEQYFDSSLQKFFLRRIARAYRLRMHSGTVSEEPRGENPGVVEDQQIRTTQQVGKFTKPAILPLTGSALQMQHTRGRPVSQWLLRDQLFRQMVVEARDKRFASSRFSVLRMT